MRQNVKALFESFKGISEDLKGKQVEKSYWEQENKVIEEMTRKSKEEFRSIRMSEQKLHKAFSL